MDMVKYVRENSPSVKMKGKILKEEPALTELKKKLVKKDISKDEII